MDVDCSLKRLLDQVHGPIVQYLFILCLFQKEPKFDKDVSSCVVWFGLQLNSLVVWVGSCLVKSGVICLGCDIWGGISVLMVLLPDHWSLVIITVSRLFVVFWVILMGLQRSFLMGHRISPVATLFLPSVFPLGLFPGLVLRVVRDVMLLLVISWMRVVTQESWSG